MFLVRTEYVLLRAIPYRPCTIVTLGRRRSNPLLAALTDLGERSISWTVANMSHNPQPCLVSPPTLSPSLILGGFEPESQRAALKRTCGAIPGHDSVASLLDLIFGLCGCACRPCGVPWAISWTRFLFRGRSLLGFCELPLGVIPELHSLTPGAATTAVRYTTDVRPRVQ
ncbi:uncharacterized protein LY89DRAFT_207550 [Mollisia scopiformis]|uniref:Uncharacterized protein n=1 Tax=Mollisia scopiformis TaxID=149040 RepID=A0A194WXN8_MOLSC|nr:uncharacterized protein LY89DRAFT_207550 [Mollisia scopiformis]KUJ12444.1 hypothetical protein LY89DRAFT_207550 [Mollisia scopiformis]